MDVKIVEFPPTRVAMLTHLGHPDKVNASAAKFIAWRRETGQSPIASSQTLVLPGTTRRRRRRINSALISAAASTSR